MVSLRAWPKLFAAAVLVAIIIVAIAYYVWFVTIQRNHVWQYVRPLTWEERERVVAAYGAYGASYKYVVVNPFTTDVGGHPVTVRQGFLTDGVTAHLGVDAIDELEWARHDFCYSAQRADDGSPISRATIDGMFTLADRRIASQMFGQSYWDEDGKVGPQFLPT